MEEPTISIDVPGNSRKKVAMIAIGVLLFALIAFLIYSFWSGPKGERRGLSDQEKARILEDLRAQSSDELSAKEKSAVLSELKEERTALSPEEKARILESLRNE